MYMVPYKLYAFVQSLMQCFRGLQANNMRSCWITLSQKCSFYTFRIILKSITRARIATSYLCMYWCNNSNSTQPTSGPPVLLESSLNSSNCLHGSQSPAGIPVDPSACNSPSWILKHLISVLFELGHGDLGHAVIEYKFEYAWLRKDTLCNRLGMDMEKVSS